MDNRREAMRKKDGGVVRTGVLCLLVSACGVVLSGASVWADEADTVAMKSEIADLKSKLSRMERALSMQETKIEEVRTARSAATGEAPTVPGPAIGMLHNLHIHGFAETSYNYNFNAPQTRTNTLRTFDTEGHGFTPHKFDLTVQTPLTDDQLVGFRTDLIFGDDAEVIHSAGLPAEGTGETEAFDLKQAYVLARAPIGEGLDFKLGKFVTPLGAEVIEDIDSFNWNYSHSYLFGYAIPFTHTGVMVSYPLLSQLSASAGIVNGWDVVNDNNGAKSVLGQLVFTPTEQVTLYYNTVFGAEQAGNNNNQRWVNDFVVLYKPTEQLQLMLNYDYGWEDDAVTLASAGESKDANWTGIAAYARYQLTDWWALAGRWEWFHDGNGTRTGFASGINGITGNDLTLYEYTVTSEFKLYQKLIARLEYRHDQADEQVFRSHDAGQRPHQDTIGVQVIYPF